MKKPPAGARKAMKLKKSAKKKPPTKAKKKEKPTGPSMIQRAMATPPADDDVGDHEFR